MSIKYMKIFAAMALSLCVVACGGLLNEDDEAEEVASLTLSADSSVITADGQSCAQLIVKYGDKEVSEDVKFYLVNASGKNQSIDLPGMIFFTETPGSYTLWCSYKAQISNKLTITAVTKSISIPGVPEDPDPSNINFHRRVLINQFTGTGCGYCPYMINLLRTFGSLSAYTDKYVLAVSHTYNGSDPMYSNDCSTLATQMGVTVYPSVLMDLRASTLTTNSTSLTNLESIFEKEYSGYEAGAGICASSVCEGGQFIVKAAIKAGSQATYKVAAWLLEDGISATQTNYGVDGDFSVHNNAVRAMSGCDITNKDFNGTSVTLAPGELASFDYAFTIGSGWNADNCHVIVYVCTSTGSLNWGVSNVIDVKPNSSVSFEYDK